MQLVRITVDLLNPNEKPIIDQYEIVSETDLAYIYLSECSQSWKRRESRRRLEKRDLGFARGRRNGLLTKCYWFVAEEGVDLPELAQLEEFRTGLKTLNKLMSADLRCYAARLASASLT